MLKIIHQAPFSLVVEGMLVGVVEVDCTSCRSSLQSDATNSSFSPAAVSGLFIGGFATGAFIILITAGFHRDNCYVSDCNYYS